MKTKLRSLLKKRILGILLCMCMVFGLLPTTALAEELDQPHDSGVTIGESVICDHHQEHTGECGYNETEGTACYYSCELCAEQESDLTCACGTEDGAHTEDCALYEEPALPECTCESTDGVHTEECPLNTDQSQPAPETDEKVEAVRALIAALPDVEDLEGMTVDEQTALYEGDLMAADEAYQMLNDEQKTQLTAENQKLDELFGFFSAPAMVMPTAVTEYDLKVGGVSVTSENASDIKGASIIDGTVSYDPDTNTLELDKAIIRYEGIGIFSTGALNITLIGTDNLIESSEHGIWVQGNLQISGDGADVSKLTVGSSSDGIFAFKNIGSGAMQYGEEIAIDDVTIDVTAGGTTGISASKSVTITDSDITTTGKKYGLQGGHFNDGYDSIISISNSTITAKATDSDAEAKAFEAAPVNSVITRWRSSSTGDWVVSPAPDFTQKYLELEFGSAASAEHASHPICGASCSHSSTHNGVTWTGVSDLGNITTAGNYYLTDNVTLTDSWKPANDVVLCLNGYTITQTHDTDSPVIEVEYPNTFTLTDCSDTPGKITHAAGRSGAGVQSYNEFIMYGGEISGNDNGGVGASGTFTLDGGVICENKGLGGVVISSNEDRNVNGLFTMKSGSIAGNESSAMGGGVWVYGTTESDGVEFILEGGAIQNNTAVNEGGGVYVGGATFTMKGGSICGNSITDNNSNGGGVFLQYSVDIDNNAIYPVFNLSGGEISGNLKGSTANNLYLTAIQKINVSGTLTGTGKIGVTTETIPSENSPVAITEVNTGNFSSYFTSDNAAYEPYNDNNIVKLRVKTVAKVNAQTPTITAEPADATYTRGETAVPLTVSASVTDGGTLSYQWFKGDGFTAIEIEGAISNTYTPPTDTVGTVEYTCAVTNTIHDNGDGGTKTATEQCSARITVIEDANSEYSISLDTTGTHTFTAATVGYAAQTAKTVTVSNTGNRTTGDLTVTLSGSNADSFTLSKNSITDIAVSGNDTFTVVPKTGLSAGTYTATVTVSGGNGITGSFDVSFTVNEVPLTYSIALSQSGTYNFPEVTEGYEAQTPLTVTVSNTGTADTGSLHVYLTGNNTQFDLVATDVIAGIAPNETKTFTIVPKTGLVASDVAYTAYVTVMNSDKGIEAGFAVKFIVNAASGNTPAPHSHSGGTATCKDEAVCTGCGQPYGSKDSNNHTGGTEVRGKVDATTTTEGYTGDTYCLGCNTKIATGTTIPKKDSETGSNTGGEDSGNDGSGIDTPPVPDDGDISPAYVTYIVQSGDTLWAIAKKYSCTVSEIVAANSDLIKNPDLIHVGWQIKIPQAGVTGADTDIPDAILPDDKKTTVYIVKQGDSLWTISKKYGCTIAEIVALNGELITDPDLIYAGWELKILQD